MKISILICVHSKDSLHDNLLLNALSSLQNQTYKNFDVFIVFDECWSNTNSIIKDDYFFKINRLYKSKKEGLSVAKNFGLKHITSDWIGFLDADDLYLPTKLEKQVNFINNNDVDFLGTKTFYKNGSNLINSNQMYPWWTKYETHEELSNILKEKENVLTHGSMLIRKSCLDNLKGYRNIKGMEDWDLWKRAIRNGYKFYQIQENLYIYTIGTSVAR
jgi:glycosyltransferase involved in cell wall biosynthesis